jgi:hypothetical protein
MLEAFLNKVSERVHSNTLIKACVKIFSITPLPRYAVVNILQVQIVATWPEIEGYLYHYLHVLCREMILQHSPVFSSFLEHVLTRAEYLPDYQSP